MEELRAFGRELLRAAQQISGSQIQCRESDDFGVMAILFTAKQTVHYETIHVLIESNGHSDATVIARVMLEGMALLEWASADPEDRARKWRAYSLVFDLRTLRTKQKRGEAVPLQDERELLSRLQTHGPMFLKPGSSEQDTGVPTAYRTRWHFDRSGKSLRISDIVGSIEDPNLLPLYDALSNWIHWNAPGLANGIRRDGDRVRIRWDSESDGALALAAGFQALYGTVRMLDQHFALEHADQLKEIRDRYVATFSAQQSRPTT